MGDYERGGCKRKCGQEGREERQGREEDRTGCGGTVEGVEGRHVGPCRCLGKRIVKW